MADLLDGILSSMDHENRSVGGSTNANTASNSGASDEFSRFRSRTRAELTEFCADVSGCGPSREFAPMDKLRRNVIHEIAEELGLVSHSMVDAQTCEGEDDRVTIVYRRASAPTEQELDQLKSQRDPEYAKTMVSRELSAASRQQVLAARQAPPSARRGGRGGGSQESFWASKKYQKVLAGQNDLVAVNQQKRDLRTVPQIEAEIAARKRRKSSPDK